MPTEKAHGIQIAKMCEAFSRFSSLEILLPKRKNIIKENIYSYYNVSNNFVIKYLNILDLVGVFPRGGFFISSFLFAKAVSKYLKKNNYKGLVYSRDLFSLYFLKNNNNYRLFYEIHNFPKKLNIFHKKLFNKIKFVAISQGLKDELEKHGISKENILVAHDGVDIENFNIGLDKKDARKKLNLPIDKKIVLYSGHLYSWKGVDTLFAAAKFIKGDIYFVGGAKEDLEKFSKKILDERYTNVFFLGQKPHKLIPIYLTAADVLVLPNSSKQKISSHYTSPIKLFEYMASNRPIVASNLPSIREVLDNSNAVFFTPDDHIDLANNINRILYDYELSLMVSKKARDDVENFSWEKRAKTILMFFNQHL